MPNAEHLEILNKGVKPWNDWRDRTPEAVPHLGGADLAGANLNGANLGGAYLRGVDLMGAYLSDANLSCANLSDADLRRSRLSGAFLVGADLSHAKLSDADLTRAKLSDAHFGGADLGGAYLNGASCWGTVFAGVDLSQVVGLDKVHHHGPSSIGLDTLFMSNGKIPDLFLRGAGVSDVLIQYAASLTGTPFEFYSCFISYSHADMSFARRLHDSLQGQGVRCWLDEKQLLPGDHIHQQVDEAVRTWDKVLLCCSEHSLISWWVDKEISKALKKEEQLWKERGKEVLAIIPLNLDGHMFDPNWQDWKKQHLTDRLAADFTGWEKDNSKFEQQLARVVRALRADRGARQEPPTPRLRRSGWP